MRLRYCNDGNEHDLAYITQEPESSDSRKRKIHAEKGNGNYSNGANYQPDKTANEQKINTIFFKPYRPCFDNSGQEIVFPYDKSRICARAIGNARAHDMLDVQLSRQSI